MFQNPHEPQRPNLLHNTGIDMSHLEYKVFLRLKCQQVSAGKMGSYTLFILFFANESLIA